MARSNPKPTEVKGSYTPKAGKKKSYTEPPAKNPAKQAAREAGLRQFIAREQLTVEEFQLKFDQKTQQFVHKRVAVTVPFLWDEYRKQFIYSPAKEIREER